MRPRISIITVAYNAETFIENTIQSVVSQSYDNIEYIIVDGLSTDSTLDICKRYSENISIMISEPDKGLYDAMNKGVEAATGEIVGILNADDFYNTDDVIEKVATAFDDSSIDCSYGDLVYVDPINTSKVVRKWISGKYKKNAFKKGWMPPHPTFFLRKKKYDQYGTYNLKLKSAADYELMLRMIHKVGLKSKYINEVLVRMRIGGVSNSSFKNRLKANKEDRYAWKINEIKPGRLTFIRKPLSKIIQFLRK
ncbi:MAG: glycosyltransferase family 2 protein [Crocinitomicaceae bacterium]